MSGVTDEAENANELQFGDINFNEVLKQQAISK